MKTMTAKSRIVIACYFYFNYLIKSMAYSSQGSHTGQLDFCNWLVDDSTIREIWLAITLR